MAAEHNQYLGNMNKVLNRQMFKAPTYEHQSTGIASGLEYRQEYRIGGMVKPKRGLVNEPGGYAGLEELMSGTGLASPLSLDEPMAAAEQLYGNVPTVDYGAETTRGDVVETGLLRTLDEQRAIRPARTLGSPNLGASLVSNLITAGKEAETRNKEMATLASAEAKQDEKDKIGTAVDLLTMSTEKDLAEKGLTLQAAQLSLGQDQLEQAFTLAEMDQETRKYVSDNLLKKQPETLQTLAYLTEEFDMTIEQAMGYAFRERNSQLQLASSLLDALVPTSTSQPGLREAAVGQVFTVMQKLFPELLDISQQELLGLIETKDPFADLED